MMNIKKIIAPMLLMLALLMIAGCTYNQYLLAQKDSLSTEIFVVPNQNGIYVVRAKDGNIWYYAVDGNTGEITKYVIFGNITSNTFNTANSQTNIAELEKSN